jgi:predicted dehydrogenase
LIQRNLEVAIVASPPQYHGRQTIQLLQAGASVLCEKPMALSVAEGKEMVAAASSAGRLLATGLVRRFLPAARTIHNILSRKMLGEVKSFAWYEGRVFQWPVHSAAYFRDNGVLRDIGVHVLDLLTWWVGEPDEILYEDDAMGGVELNCRVHLKFPQGFTGEVRLSREFRLANTFAIQCEHGRIDWDIDETNKIQIGLYDSRYSLAGSLYELNSTDQDLASSDLTAADFRQSFVNQLKNLIAAVRGSEPLLVPGETGLASLKVIDSCYAQRSLMYMPWLGEQEILRARQLAGRLSR